MSDTPLARKRNREAVRKYRQRKRDQTQGLAQEVEQLRADNVRLRAELQQQSKINEEMHMLRRVLNSVRQVRRPCYRRLRTQRFGLPRRPLTGTRRMRQQAVGSVQQAGASDLAGHMGGGGQVLCMLPPQQLQQFVPQQPQQLQQPQMGPPGGVGDMMMVGDI